MAAGNPMRCLFVSDLHGRTGRYRALLDAVERERPAVVLLGGDLLPHSFARGGAAHFVQEEMAAPFAGLRQRLGPAYPRVLLILGNDDGRRAEATVREAGAGLWTCVHGSHLRLGRWTVFGYSCVPPTPFALKDWERYDVSRYVEPGCVSPEEGYRTVPADPDEVRNRTISADLDALTAGHDMERAVLLLHAPPYRTALDRAALDGRTIDHVPLDVHVGSVAVRRFVEDRQPLLTLHGHIHESARLTGSWRDRIGRTEMLGAAHDGPELALVRVDLADPAAAVRDLVPTTD